MNHGDLRLNHIIENWTFANAAARNALATALSSDIGKIGYQADTGQYWRLLTVAPTWQLTSALGLGAVLQGGSVATLTTTSATFPGVMMGVAGLITPILTGRIFVTICGSCSHSATPGSGQLVLRYGLMGTKPANGAAVTGTVAGTIQGIFMATGPQAYPISLSAVITGLTVGSQYWLDVSGNGAVAGTFTLVNAAICAHEI